MARPVNTARHEARRLQIIDAALTRIAQVGYERATTASICRTARIGSGTFFHYFPTKADVLIATIELGTAETREFFNARTGSPVEILRAWVDHCVEELADPRAAAFVQAVGGLSGDERIVAALRADEAVVRTRLGRHVRAARRRGDIRTDIPAERVVSWLMTLTDALAIRAAEEDTFDPAREGQVLRDLVQALLTGSAR